MVDFWQTQFHHYGGDNLIATQCFSITGNKNVPQIDTNKVAPASPRTSGTQ